MKRQNFYLIFIGLGVTGLIVHTYVATEFKAIRATFATTWNGFMTFDPLSSEGVSEVKLNKLLPKPLNYMSTGKMSETVIRIPRSAPLESIPVSEDAYKLIVFHTRNYGHDFLADVNWTFDGTFYYPDSVFQCPKKCKGSMDRMLATRADALVFSILDDMYHTKIGEIRYPSVRRPGQIWVATTIEAPLYHHAIFLGVLGHLFNWTFTYRLDSDVYLPYGYFYKSEMPIPLSHAQLPDEHTLKSKKLAVSLMSNCGARSKRDSVMTAMKKYVAVDHYGGCGTPCPPETDCRTYLAAHYKFFLAFENSLCQDYITEKLFDTLTVDMVPVTFGLGDYAEVAPPHSYVNALDFPNVQALTDYLKFLDANDAEYVKYFHWKGLYVKGPRDFANEFCSLCLKLWEEPKNYTQQITSFDDWWNHKRPPTITARNLTLGGEILRDAKTACVPASQVFASGYLN